MGDNKYDEEYKSRKEKLKKLHKGLKGSRDIQEIYHKIMGSDDASSSDDDTTD